MYRYKPIDSVLLEEPDAHVLFQQVTDHYLNCAGRNFGNVDQLADVPPSVRAVWCLWLFLAEVGGSGITGYLSNCCHQLSELQEIHSALARVGADDLLELLETGVRITLDEDAGEYLEDPGAREWSAQFERSSPREGDGLDQRSYEVAGNSASEIVASFIRANHSDF